MKSIPRDELLIVRQALKDYLEKYLPMECVKDADGIAAIGPVMENIISRKVSVFVDRLDNEIAK